MDVAVLAVGPVETRRAVVDSQAVRPEQPRGHDDTPRARVAVHTSSLYLRNLAPVSPEHQPA